MDIKYEFRNMEQVQKLADRAPDVFLRNMMAAAKVSVRDVQRTAQTKHKFRSRSGFTELAIDTAVRADSQEGVVGEVFLNDAISPYGKFLHDGSGLYGPFRRKYLITPKRRKWLRWPAGDGFRFAKKVMHPGIKGDPFIYNAGEANQAHINDVFNRYVDRAAKEIER